MTSLYSFYIISTPKPKDLKYGLARPGGAGFRLDFAYTNSFFAYYADGTPELKDSTPEKRQVVDRKYRISIWVQKERIRVYQNEVKLFDVVKAMSKNVRYNMIRFECDVPMISNFRISTRQPDIRNKLLTDGKIVSYGIYFDVNSDKLKPESAGTLKEIAAILQENPTVKMSRSIC